MANTTLTQRNRPITTSMVSINHLCSGTRHAYMFVIGFIIGAALPSTFGSAFSTVEQKIKQTSTQLKTLKRKEKAATHADYMQKRVFPTRVM